MSKQCVTSETYLKRKVIQFIKKAYPNAWIYKTSDRWTSGIPDLLVCIRGLLFAIELKVGANKATKLQNYTIRQIIDSGGYAKVCRSVSEVKEFLRRR